MQDIWERNHESWGDVELFIVNSRGSEDGLPDLTDGVTLPVFQDTSEDDVYTSYVFTPYAEVSVGYVFDL